MPNQLDDTGLTIKSTSEIVKNLAGKLKSIYQNEDINVDSNSPDGQLINIFAQAVTDQLELLLAVYNSFDPDVAFGKNLDQRAALNGCKRQEGTFTFTPVEVTTDRSVSLKGLDDNVNDLDGTGYTVADDEGNEFILAKSFIVPAGAPCSLMFRAAKIGRVEARVNKITKQSTIVLGVTNVNNPSTAGTILGQDEESDASLKVKRAGSFSLAATGCAEALQATLLNTSGVADAIVYENNESIVLNGVPANSIWCIVEGGSDADIAQAIYAKKSPGCGMKGDVSYSIQRPNSVYTFDAKFDRPIMQNLYIRFSLEPKKQGMSFDHDYIKRNLVDQLNFKLNQKATANAIVLLLAAIEPDAIVYGATLSTDGLAFDEKISPTDMQHKFVADVARVTIS